MDGGRLWKLVERGGLLIGTVCALATTYFTVGIFYHWDAKPNAGAATPGAAIISALWPLIVLGMLALATLLTSWIMILVRRRSTGIPSSPLTEGKMPIAPIKTRYLKEAFVYGGSDDTKSRPRYWARLAKNVKTARLFIDYSYFPGSGPNWTQRTRIALDEIDDRAREQIIDVNILSTYDQDSKKFWRWGKENSPPTDNKYLFFRTHYRGRIVFMADDGTEERCYFIVEKSEREGEAVPHVIGEHMFKFTHEWESEVTGGE